MAVAPAKKREKNQAEPEAKTREAEPEPRKKAAEVEAAHQKDTRSLMR